MGPLFPARKKSEKSDWIGKNLKRPTIAKSTQTSKKALNAIFFDSNGLVVQYAVPQGKSVTGNMYSSHLHEKEFIQRWREEDVVYFETHNFQEMLDKVREQHYMTFVGVPGSGKSATIHHIAFILQSKGYEIVPIIDIKKIEDYCDPSNAQVFVVDDVFPDLILQYIDSSFVAKRVKIHKCQKQQLENETQQDSVKVANSDGNKQKEKTEVLGCENKNNESLDLCITLTEDQYSMLAERFYRDIKNMDLYDVFMNDVLKEPKVCHAFLDLLMTKPYTELKVLFLSEQKDVSKVVSTGKNAYGRKSYRQQFLVNERTISLRISTYSVRIISWVIYCGHSQILKYILTQLELQNEIQSELFWNNCKPGLSSAKKQSKMKKILQQMTDKLNPLNLIIKSRKPKQIIDPYSSEKCRLLLLSCYSGDLETFSLCVKYFHKNEINKELRSFGQFRVAYDTPLLAACEDGHMNIVQELLEVGADVNLQGTRETPLEAACKHGHVKVVKQLLETGADVNIQGWKNTPLTAACKHGRINVVKHLIEKGADVNLHDRQDTPLTAACEDGHDSVVKVLLEVGADVNLRGKFATPLIKACRNKHMCIVNELLRVKAAVNQQCLLDTPLIAACGTGRVDIVKKLVKAGAYVNLKGLYSTPMTEAYNHGHMDVVKELKLSGANLNLEGNYETPLIAACTGGNINAVKQQLEEGADAGADVNYVGIETPLTEACLLGSIDVVKILLEAGAEINKTNHFLTSPLTRACMFGHLSLVKDLIKAGADVNMGDFLHTPLAAACIKGDILLVKELLEAGANVNPHDGGESPLSVACDGGDIRLVIELLEAGANVNPQDGEKSPLAAACKKGDMRVVLKLLEAGADVNPRDGGKAPLTAACEVGDVSVVKKLLEAGANVNPQGRNKSPLTAACETGFISVVKELLEAGANVNPQDGVKSPLAAACKKGDMRVIMKLIEAGANVNPRDGGKTPLTAACEVGDISVVKELLKAGAIVNPEGGDNTPLTAACELGDVRVVTELLKAGANVNLQGTDKPPLTAACEVGIISVVEKLLEVGADVNLQYEKETPLIKACKHGYIGVIKELLKAGADVNFQGESDTPLTAACKCGAVSVVMNLLQAGADANLQCEFYTPLKIACTLGLSVIVKELIHNVNLKDSEYTLLGEYVYMVDVKMTKVLLEAGANIDGHREKEKGSLYKADFKNAMKVLSAQLMFSNDNAHSKKCDKAFLSSVYIQHDWYKLDVVEQIFLKIDMCHLCSLELPFYDCSVNSIYAYVQTSKDDMFMTQRRVWHMKMKDEFYQTVIYGNCNVLKYLLSLSLDVNQWICLHYKGMHYLKPLLFALIDENRVVDRVEKWSILLEAGVNINIRVLYKEYQSLADDESEWIFDRKDNGSMSALEDEKTLV
ncbi:ankyrin repeat domain-containing protein 17-like [Saccostrea cucullata]|uniref:ankyrin repeat domain-containing protein 17-like n=1 Tax=Saccostrea cuccullata TaxID=36930 RepID=UPI002ED59736